MSFKKILGGLIVGAGITFALVVSGAPTSTIVQNLYITGLKSSGSPILSIDSNGLVSTTTNSAASFTTSTLAGLTDTTWILLTGGGISISTTTSPSRITFTNTGVTTTTGNWLGTLQGKSATDFLSSSTTFVATTTGNWLGTWQSKNPSDFLSSSTSFQTPITLNGSTYLGVASSSGTWTFTNNGVQTLTGSTYLGVSSATGTPTLTNNGVQTLSSAATSGLAISSATGTIIIYNNGVTSTIAGTNITQTASGGTVTINTTTTPTFTTVTLSDSIAHKYAEKPLCQLLFSYATSSSQWFDDCIIGTTSTITRVIVKNQTNADAVTWNLYYNNTIPQATTTTGFKVFTADQTTNTTTTAALVPSASSTPNGLDFIRLFAYNASSSEFSITIMGKDR